MRLIISLGAVFAVLASAAWAQDGKSDRNALKKRILELVERKLKLEEERLLKEIEKIIDEELAKSPKGVRPSRHEAPPKGETPKAAARGWLGIRGVELVEEECEELGVEAGVRVDQVVEDGPAAKAGLKVDDVIIGIDGKDVAGSDDLPSAIKKKGAGAELRLKIIRDGKESELKIQLGTHPDDKQGRAAAPRSEEELRERIKKFLDRQAAGKAQEDDRESPRDDGEALPGRKGDFMERMRKTLEDLGLDPGTLLEKGKDGIWRLRRDFRELFKDLDLEGLNRKAEEPGREPARQESRGQAWLGVMPEELGDDVRAQLDLEDGIGISVAEVRKGSPAEGVLEKGDILLKIDGTALPGEEGLRKAIAQARPGQEITLTILRKGAEKKLTVKLGERRD